MLRTLPLIGRHHLILVLESSSVDRRSNSIASVSDAGDLVVVLPGDGRHMAEVGKNGVQLVLEFVESLVGQVIVFGMEFERVAGRIFSGEQTIKSELIVEWIRK